MGNIQQSILQSKINELNARRERLTQKLDVLQPAQERETRPEEQLRLDHIIAETQAQRQQVETDLIKLEDELSALQSSGPAPVPSPPSPTPPPPRRLATGPIEVFYSYSHEDEELKKRLETHLALLTNRGIIKGWHDRLINPGTEWEGQINQYLESAHIILLLISPDFLASKYCYAKEMKRAIERHEAGEATVIPIILRAVDWKDAPFSHLQALPKNARAVTSWPNQDEAFADIAQGIRKVAEELAGKF